jgi:hypothetical protein
MVPSASRWVMIGVCGLITILCMSWETNVKAKDKFTEPENRIVFHLSERSVVVSNNKTLVKGEQLNEIVEWLNNDSVIQILLARQIKGTPAVDDEEEFPIQGHRNELPRTSSTLGTTRSEGCNCGGQCLCSGNCKCEKGHPVYYNVKSFGITPRTAGGNFRTYNVQCGIDD